MAAEGPQHCNILDSAIIRTGWGLGCIKIHYYCRLTLYDISLCRSFVIMQNKVKAKVASAKMARCLEREC